MRKVLFVCVHNSARSQMAEAFLNHLGQGAFIAESAGLEKGTLNPLVVKAMKEIGYDLSNNETHGVFDYYREGRTYSYVVKVCDELNGQRCPIFPSTLKYLRWNLQDPASFQGNEEEVLEKIREVRDQIKELVLDFIAENSK